jgi:hypothetical protein
MKGKQITLMSYYGYSQTETKGKQIGPGKLDMASHRGRAWKPKGTRHDDTRLLQYLLRYYGLEKKGKEQEKIQSIDLLSRR